MNRQALTEALADESAGRWSWQLPMFVAAARLVERLLPGECDCGGTGIHPNDEPWPHPDCHGSGQVWDEEIVEVVAKALHDPPFHLNYGQCVIMARAVLSAIAQLAEAGSQ